MLDSGSVAFYFEKFMKAGEWFKPKKYPHIGYPITAKAYGAVKEYIQNENNIRQHPFLPLIKRVQRIHKYKLKDGKCRRTVKERPICYASHLEAQIFSYYAKKLEEKFENYMASYGYAEHVTAYRSIKRKTGNGNKCNIDLAKDAFDYIKSAVRNGPLIVISADISGFFDHLDHSLLKEAWKEICAIDQLNPAEYKVFKNVTKYSYVRIDDLFHLFHKEIVCQTKSGKKKKNIKHLRYFRDKEAVAFCNRKSINKIRKRGFITTNKKKFGIPQGLPISAVLANIYMHSFDKSISKFIKNISGFYNRYSDDIILICPFSYKEMCTDIMQKELRNVKLDYSQEKTRHFKVAVDGDSIPVIDENTNKPTIIEYLGFCFDGKTILIKNKNISKYYQKLHHTIGIKTWYAIHKRDSTRGAIFTKQILKKFTPIGSKKRKVFIRRKDKIFYPSDKKTFGNFWTYVEKSATICNSPSIKHQLHRNKAILQKSIEKAKANIHITKKPL